MLLSDEKAFRLMTSFVVHFALFPTLFFPWLIVIFICLFNFFICFSFISGGNLTYEIPKGIADDSFTVDSLRGIVTTKGTFDRETKDLYTVPIYVYHDRIGVINKVQTKFSNQNSQFDVATIVIRITDVNDHAPEFRPGSCYPLSIPENSDLSIIHQVVATDLDEGPNGDITYSITGKQSIVDGVFLILAPSQCAVYSVSPAINISFLLNR